MVAVHKMVNRFGLTTGQTRTGSSQRQQKRFGYKPALRRKKTQPVETGLGTVRDRFGLVIYFYFSFFARQLQI